MNRMLALLLLCLATVTLVATSCSRQNEPTTGSSTKPPLADPQPPAPAQDHRPAAPAVEPGSDAGPGQPTTPTLSPSDRALAAALRHLQKPQTAETANLNQLPPEIRERLRLAHDERKKNPLRYEPTEIEELDNGRFLVRFEIFSGTTSEPTGSRELEIDSQGRVCADRMSVQNGSSGSSTSSGSSGSETPR